MRDPVARLLLLRLAEEVGAIAIDDSKGSPVDQVMEHTNGTGADRGAECVGYQAHDLQGQENNSVTLNELVSSARFTGGIGTVGVYVPEDPGAPDDLAKHGKTRFDFGEFWFKGQYMGTGSAR
jgi:glutathione-independent formaldehyde dehydrogenase